MLEGDARFREPDPMKWAEGEAETFRAAVERMTFVRGEDDTKPSLWQRLTAPWRALAAMSRNAQRLAEIVDTIDRDGTLKRLERAARILDNQQGTQRQLVDQVHNMERAMIEVARRVDSQALPSQTAPVERQLDVGVSG